MAAPQAQATLPLIWPAWREGKPDWQIVDLAAYIGEGFNLNSLIYAAIMYKARAITAAPLRAYTGGMDHSEVLPPDHDLSVLTARPNAWQSGLEFMQVNVVYLNLAGEAFILCGRRTATGPIASMVSLRPDRVFPIPAEGGLKGYLYVPEGKATADGTPILTADMMHVKLPNPGDPLEGWGRGLSPMSALARSADVDNDITAFIKLFFERGAMPSSYLRFDKPMIESQLARARERYMEVYGGYRNWTDILVMDSGGEVKPMSMTFNEMGFDALDERNESRILGPFGVPPILLGTRTGLNRSTYCLPAEALVGTPCGPKPIIELSCGDEIWGLADGAIVPSRVMRAGMTGRKLLYEVKTKNRTLRASGNHPVLVRVPGNRGENGQANGARSASLRWKRVDELTTRDWLVEPKSLPDLGGGILPNGEAATTEMLQMLGAIVGDGTVRRGVGVRVAMPSTDRCAAHYVELSRRLFTRQPRGELESPVFIQHRQRDFGFSSAHWSRLLGDWGFGGRALTKCVPAWVFGLRRDLRLAFLAGIVDSDGSIDKRGTLAIGFANRLLALDVRELCLSVGIQSSNVYHRIMSPSVLPQRGSRDAYHLYTFVASAADSVGEIPFCDPVYRERIEANHGRHQDCGFDAQRAGLATMLGFYKVHSVKALFDADVYDIEVEGGHCFIADGIVVHNSNYAEARKAFWEDTFLPEMRLFEVELQYRLQTKDGGWVRFDTSGVPALQRDVPKLADTAYRLWAMGVPANRALQAVGLDVGEVPGGDTSYIPLSVTGVGATPPPVQGVTPSAAGKEAVKAAEALLGRPFAG